MKWADPIPGVEIAYRDGLLLRRALALALRSPYLDEDERARLGAIDAMVFQRQNDCHDQLEEDAR